MKSAWVQVIFVFAKGIFLLVLLPACTEIVPITGRGQSGPPGQPAVVGVIGSAVPRQLILASVYDYLYKAGLELPYYGLYSYALFPAHSPRAERFLEELFKTTSHTAANLIDVENLNIIYLPTRGNQLNSLQSIISEGSTLSAGVFVTQFYDYHLAQKLLTQICTAPAEVIYGLCATDLSHGPYLFTYARPASTLSPVPPPYLILDLSHVHTRAFGEFIAAYKAQIKRMDYSDYERIDTLRLRVLNILLTAADWIIPTKSAIADILHIAKGETSPPK